MARIVPPLKFPADEFAALLPETVVPCGRIGRYRPVLVPISWSLRGIANKKTKKKKKNVKCTCSEGRYAVWSEYKLVVGPWRTEFRIFYRRVLFRADQRNSTLSGIIFRWNVGFFVENLCSKTLNALKYFSLECAVAKRNRNCRNYPNSILIR